MSGKRLWIAVLTVITMLVASAVAQDEKNELGGTPGRTFISNQGIKNATFPNPIIAFGNGLSFDGVWSPILRGPCLVDYRGSCDDGEPR